MADKKLKKQQEQAKIRMQKQKQLMQEHKKRYMPLVKFMKKQGVPFKYARVGQSRIEYFRYDDYTKFQQLCKQKIESNNTLKQLFSQLQSKSNLIYFKRPSDSKNLKYPHILQPVHPSDPNAKFCSFKFDTTISRKGLMFGVVIGALALVLFPVWPFSVKYAIWLISLYLLIFLIGLLTLRLIIYLFCVIAGFNVWILPNLLGDYGFIDSFKPLIYYQRWQRNMFNIVIRIGAVMLFVYYGIQIYMDPTFLESHFTVTKSTIDDIHDWGVSKIKNQVKFSERAITNLQDILNQTADVQDDGQGQGGKEQKGEGEEKGRNQRNIDLSEDRDKDRDTDAEEQQKKDQYYDDTIQRRNKDQNQDAHREAEGENTQL